MSQPGQTNNTGAAWYGEFSVTRKQIKGQYFYRETWETWFQLVATTDAKARSLVRKATGTIAFPHVTRIARNIINQAQDDVGQNVKTCLEKNARDQVWAVMRDEAWAGLWDWTARPTRGLVQERIVNLLAGFYRLNRHIKEQIEETAIDPDDETALRVQNKQTSIAFTETKKALGNNRHKYWAVFNDDDAVFEAWMLVLDEIEDLFE